MGPLGHVNSWQSLFHPIKLIHLQVTVMRVRRIGSRVWKAVPFVTEGQVILRLQVEGAIAIKRCTGSKLSLNGRNALKPSRTGASASAPEMRSVGIRLNVRSPIAIVLAATRLLDVCPP